MIDAGRPAETLTIMMMDVEGSIALLLERGDTVADEMLRAHAGILREQLAKHRGHPHATRARRAQRRRPRALHPDPHRRPRRGRFEEVRSLYESARSIFPTGEGTSSIGRWNCMLGFVEALYLSGFCDAAGALLPLVEKALTLDPEWLAFDGRLIRTRAGVAAAASGRWDDAEEHLATALKARADDAERTGGGRRPPAARGGAARPRPARGRRPGRRAARAGVRGLPGVRGCRATWPRSRGCWAAPT